MAVVESFPELPLFDLQLQPQDLEAVAETLRSGWLTLGPRTAEFEQAFAAHLGARHAIALSNCTAALHLAYLAAGAGPGDEVIVPSFTFAATAAAALYCGATPVFAEIVSRSNPSLDPEDVERRITPRTKAVCVVHYAGYAAAADRLKELCDAHGIPLIEDVAHAPSATLGGRKLGTWGLAGAFSFFSNKVLSVGEGGLLCTDSDEVAEIRTLAPLARDDKRHLGPSHRPHRHLRRHRPRLQLPPGRAARGAAAVAPAATGCGNHSQARAHGPLSRACSRRSTGSSCRLRTPRWRAPPAT